MLIPVSTLWGTAIGFAVFNLASSYFNWLNFSHTTVKEAVMEGWLLFLFCAIVHGWEYIR
tara:strand:- start:1739 stop:1918 length:180 start_codon:yes stop_codon:yes gene_type:complete